MYQALASWQHPRPQTLFGWTGDMRTILFAAAFVPASVCAIEPQQADYHNHTQYSHTSSNAAALSKSAAVGVGIAGGGNAYAFSGGGNGGEAKSSATGGQGGKSTATSGSSSVTYNEAPAAQQRGTVTIKNTPDVTLSNIAPSADCMGVTTLGGSAAGFSAAGGTSWESKPCQLRETARVFHALGNKDDAIAVLCTSEYAAAAPSCIAMKQQRAE